MKENGQKTMINDLTTGPVTRQLLTFAAPFVMSSLLQTVYNMVDMVIIGHFVGSAGLAGVSVGGELLHLFTMISMGLTAAGQVMISQYVGAGEEKQLSRTIGTMFTMVMAIAVALSAVGLLSLNWVLGILNTPADALQGATDYSLVCLGGLVFTYGYNMVSAVLRGMGDSKRPFLFIAIAAVLNLLLDMLFVAGFSWGTAGAALATIMSQALSFIISIVYLYRRREAFGFDFKPASFIPDREKLGPLFKLGGTMALQHCAIMISILYINSYINTYGVAASAVSGVGNKLTTITTVVTSSLGTAATAMIGQNLGAGKHERVTRIMNVSFAIGLCFSAVLSVLMILLPRQIFALFNTEPEVLDMASLYVWPAVINFFGFALRAPCNALINALGYASLGLTICLLDGVVARIGFSLVLGIGLAMGIQGFWFGSALAGHVSALLGGIYYLSGRWRTRKLIIKK